MDAGAPTVVVLYGPTAVGKSEVADLLQERFDVHHVDADRLVLALLADGGRPDPRDGWLAPVREAVEQALTRFARVSVEATGAWDSDVRLAADLERTGVRVVRVWVWAPEDQALRRLAERTTPRAPVSPEEALRIHRAATQWATTVAFDVRIDTSGARRPDEVEALVARVLRPAAD